MRVNVYEEISEGYGYEDDGRVLAGWFHTDSARYFPEDTYWDGNNHISASTRSQWDHQGLYLTAGGRWVKHAWSQWQGSTSSYKFISPDEARNWLLMNHSDDEVAELFGPIEDEKVETT